MTAPEQEATARTDRLVELTIKLVAAYVSRNAVPPAVLPTMIESVHASLIRVTTVFNESGVIALRPQPAIDPKKSVTDDYIICLEDGRRFKSLKRHLMKAFGLTPERYREKWQLERSYPMVAPNYAAIRSQLAKNMALGRKRKAAG
jgi:predicted transcriptional regulator